MENKDYTLLKKVSLKSISLLLLCTGSLSASPVEKDGMEMGITNETQQNGKTIRGVVQDALGPIPGANIVIKGTTNGIITDTDGNYTLEDVPTNAILQVSFMGYLSQEIKVGDQSVIDILLKENTQLLDEVVVVGYGTQKKVNLTGAVTQVTSKDMENRPVGKVTQMLQGVMPNVNISFSTAQPGAGGSINVRGRGSVNGGDPLVLIDGVPGDINRINPNDVESISVLKDAAASAIYGARGAFGVILVTTKNAKTGKMSITYNGFAAISSPTVSTDFITSGYESVMLNDEAFRRTTGNTYTRYSDEDYAELEARRYDKVENPERPWVVVKNVNGKDIYNYYGNYDWWDFLYKDNQFSQSHNVSLSGGDDKLNFLISGNYYSQDGLMKINTDKFQSYTFHSKINAQIFPFLKIFNNTQYYDQTYRYTGREGGANINFLNTTVHALPCYAPINPDGTFTYNTLKNNYSIGDGMNAMLLDGKNGGAKGVHEFRTTVGGVLDLGQYVKLNADYTYQFYMADDWYRAAVVEYSVQPGILQDVPNYNTDQYKKTNWFDPMHVFNAYLNYDQTFGVHSVSATAGVNYETKKHARLYASRKNLISDSLNDLNLGTGDMEVGGGQYQYVLFGAFFRANYNYAERYLVEFNGRYDGTSRYKKNMRYGFFPSGSAAWRVSEEAFFDSWKEEINNMKVRFSYGTLGNQLMGNSSTSANYYPYVEMMPMNLSSWLINGQKTQNVSSPNPIIDNLTWEKATTTNIGLDLSFLNNRLNFSGDYYIRNTTDMLIPGETLPGVFGATSPKQNAGDMKTKGYEISLAWNDQFTLAGKPFKYGVSFGLGDAVSDITKFESESSKANSQNNRDNFKITDNYEGKRYGEIWGYKIDGYFKSDEEAANWKVDQTQVNSQIQKSPGEWGHLRAGDLKFVDVNDDGKITPGTSTVGDHGDLVVIGNSEPRYNYNFNLNASWSGIDVSALFQGIGRRDWYPASNADKFWGPFSRPYYSFVPSDFTEKLWSEDNPNSYFPVLRGYTALNGGGSLNTANDKYIQNIGYLRLKNLVIGYTLPDKLTQKAGIQNLRIYVSGENLITWTLFETDYIDPEQPIADSNGRSYPLNKTLSIGLDITF